MENEVDVHQARQAREAAFSKSVREGVDRVFRAIQMAGIIALVSTVEPYSEAFTHIAVLALSIALTIWLIPGPMFRSAFLFNMYRRYRRTEKSPHMTVDGQRIYAHEGCFRFLSMTTTLALFVVAFLGIIFAVDGLSAALTRTLHVG